MNKLKVIAGATSLVAIIAIAFSLYTQHKSNDEILILKQETERVEQKLFTYTKYTDFISAGKEALRQQIKLLAAKTVRSDTRLQYIDKKFLGLISSNASVVINYTTEYSFGFDLKPESFEVIKGKNGIEIVVGRPILVASPAILKKSYTVPSGGLLINSEEAVIKLYEGLPEVTLTQGKALAATPEIVALCEKTLIAFFRDFLAKQPGVGFVPNIDVVYK